MLLTLLLCTASPVSEGPPPILQPKVYASRSGEYRLHVDPSARQGSGPGTCTLEQGERTVWSAELPYTFWEAAVSDAGEVFGYAYTHGSRDYRVEGQFVVALLSRQGREVVKETTKRTPSRWMHSAPDPLGFGCFVHEDLGLAVARVRDPGDEDRVETWRAYRLDGGERVEVFDPRRGLERPEDVARTMDAQAIAGTPLTLTWFFLREGGVLFTLTDAAGALVWQLRRSEDPMDVDLRPRSAILDTGTARRFALWHVRDGERVDYEVVRSAAPRDGREGDAAWIVQEIGRSPEEFVERSALQREEPAWPTIKLDPRTSVPLQTDAAESPIRDVSGFALRAEGVEFVRREGKGAYTLVQLDAGGVVLRERRIGTADEEHTAVRWHALADGAWLLCESPYGAGTRARAARLAAGSLVPEPLARLDCPSIQAVAELPGDALALLVTERGEYSMTDALVVVERDGSLRWAVSEDLQQGSKLFSPSDVAATRDGRIVVVCTIANVLQVYGQDGTHLRTIDLAQAWGTKPRYPADVSVASDGRVLVMETRDADPSAWTMSLDGDVLTSFVPRLADGRRITGDARFASDGRAWTGDGSCFMRLDAEGVVDLVVGEASSSERLDTPGSIAFDRAGRVLVQDQRSGSVHVFDGTTGEPAFVCSPAPGDFAEGHAVRSRLYVAPDGRILASGVRGGALLAFDATGERLGPVELSGSLVDFVPGSQRTWGKRDDYPGADLVLSDAHGRELAVIDRDPDGSWFSGNACVSSDGRLCTIGADYVALHAPSGERLRTITIDSSPRIGFASGLAFEGDWLVVGTFAGMATLVHLTDGAVRSFPFRPDGSSACAFGLSPGGDELWAVAADELVLHRLALPE